VKKLWSLVVGAWKVLAVIATVVILGLIIWGVVSCWPEPAPQPECVKPPAPQLTEGVRATWNQTACKWVVEVVEPPTVPITTTAGITNTGGITLTTGVTTTTEVIVAVGEWSHVDFEPTGGHLDTENIDHDGDVNRVTVAWFHARPEGQPDPGPCVAHVVTAPDGERIELEGAYRTWVFGGEPTKQDVWQLVVWWVSQKLETEPRGVCAEAGAYTVTWQDSSLDPGTPKGRPAVTVVPNISVDESVVGEDLYAQTGVNIRRLPEIADGNIVGSLKAGEKITVLEVKGRWVRHAKGWSAKTGDGMVLLASEPPELEVEPEVADGPGEWEELDFHPTGGSTETWMVDHEGEENRLTIVWFWARLADQPVPVSGFTALAITSPNPVSVTAAGASRTWQWTGSTVSSEEEVEAQVETFRQILEDEAGNAYTVVRVR